jgi:hypothetical protein
MKTILAIPALAAIITIALIVSHVMTTAGKGFGLVHYFARLGIEVDYLAIVIAVGLIPVFWLGGFLIRTWMVK